MSFVEIALERRCRLRESDELQIDVCQTVKHRLLANTPVDPLHVLVLVSDYEVFDF